MTVEVCTCVPLHRELRWASRELHWASRELHGQTVGSCAGRRVPWWQRAREGSQEMLPTVTALGLS